ncbi:leucine-rich_repeat domain-containing protein [Hexamita inflata]|uniref:Leucine-rich repeat domain-containing protein n=1 Tax=Hexamita inflata TaxID=28002 RepID=A0AA86UVH5_9EUKA|nr:leucine-rich repeat domain-containing protein [Hexamita inflata]
MSEYNVEMSECINVTFTSCPLNLKYLTLINCNQLNLDGIKGLGQLKKLQISQSILRSLSPAFSLTNLLSLEITDSKLTNIVGIEHLEQLQFLDLSNNSILSIEPLKALNNLKQIKIDYNFVQDLEYLLPNHPESIYYQNTPSDLDYENYIADIRLTISVQELKAQFAPKLLKSNELIQQYPIKYDNLMKETYKSKISKTSYGPYLYIQYDDDLYDLSFIEELGVTDLYLNGCPNAHLLRVPKTLKCLQHYGANLKTIKGVERLVQIQYLDLAPNSIVNINRIRALQNIQEIYLHSNKINDLSPVDYLKTKELCKNGCRIDNQITPTQEEINEAMLW